MAAVQALAVSKTAFFFFFFELGEKKELWSLVLSTAAADPSFILIFELFWSSDAIHIRRVDFFCTTYVSYVRSNATPTP